MVARYIVAVRLDRSPGDTEIDALWIVAGTATRITRGERAAVLVYTREADTLAHAVAAIVEEITRMPGLHPWWIEPDPPQDEPN